MNNPIGDMLIRIKNASRVRHPRLEMPYSTLKEKLAKILEEKGYLAKVVVLGKPPSKTLQIELKYQDRRPGVTDVRQYSKPGLRRYLKSKDLSHLRKTGESLVILSTPKGLVSLEEARKKNIGGELLCEVW